MHTSTEARAEALGAGWKGQDPGSDLHSLLTEIQALRAQLERSIETNSTLRSKLEEQLAQGARKAQEGTLPLPAQALSVPEWPLNLDKHGMASAFPRFWKIQLCASVCDE